MGSVPPAGIPSGELLWCPPPTLSPDMDTLAVSLVDLWHTPGVQEKIEESARVFFSNSILTVNLIPALLVGALLLFLLPFLLGLPILNGLGGGGSSASYGSNLEVSDGYGAPSSSYGAPEASYGAPEPSYGAPEPSYGAPAATTRQSRTAMTRHQAATTQADVSGQLNCPPKPGTSTPTSTLPTRCSTATALHNLPSTPLPRPNINLVEACRSSTRFMKGFWDPICAKTYLSPLWDP